MSAYIIVNCNIKDAEKFAEYGSKAGATFAPYGGKLIKRGKLQGTLSGTPGGSVTAVFEFSDADAVQAWYQSDDYQALLPLRSEACDMNISVYVD
ncbi:MAG: DUF1330 domain-containing protein [Pseudomonadota bacterium]